MRGTAFAARDEIQFTNIRQLPSGREMAAEFRGITLINTYVPSGTVKRRKWEHFYNSELAYLTHPPTYR
jgi:exonuclease III